jgi:hypothetical protein
MPEKSVNKKDKQEKQGSFKKHRGHPEAVLMAYDPAV